MARGKFDDHRPGSTGQWRVVGAVEVRIEDWGRQCCLGELLFGEWRIVQRGRDEGVRLISGVRLRSRGWDVVME